jgi:hypothetical protein
VLVLQNSPALAGVVIATNAIANSAVAGAAVIFKSCLVVFSGVGLSPETEMGCQGTPRHRHRKKAKEFSPAPHRRSNVPHCHDIEG